MISVTQEIDNFLTTNATGTTAVYVPTTAYAANALVRELDRVYKSIGGGNLGNYPPNTKNKFWYDFVVSNEFAMLDMLDDTVTNFTANGIVTFTRGTKEVIAIGNFQATQVLVQYLDASDVLLDTDTYDFSSLGNRVNKFEYIYADFSTSQTQAIYKPLKRIGTKVKVTFSRGGLSTYCGMFVAGKATDLGQTLDKVNFVNRLIGFDKKRTASFQTTVKNNLFNLILDYGKTMQNVPLLFVIDPQSNSSHQNLVTIAKITDSSGTAETHEYNQISWELTQN